MRLIYAKLIYISIINRVFTKKKACILSLITKLLPAGLHLSSFDHQHQLGTVNHTATLGQRGRGEGALLQAFVVQHIPASLPVKQLDQRSSAAQKHKDLPAGRIPTQLITNQPRQPAKAFPSIP